MLRRLVVLGLAAGAAIVRRDLVVRAVRAIDRRSGLFAPRGARVYARGSQPLLAGLHRRVAADAGATLETPGAMVVAMGSGPGDLLAELRSRAPEARVVGVEPSEDMREIAAQRGVVSVDGRAEALPFADGAVDLVISTLSSHHWENVRAAFAAIRRVLRPGGEARIYDFRFAGYGPKDARAIASGAGIAPANLEHTVLGERLFALRPYSLITLKTALDDALAATFAS